MDRPLLTDTYHRLVSLSWPRFLLLVVGLYLVIIFAFACVYWLVGDIRHAYDEGPIMFQDCMHFSYTTLTTVGYGDIRPIGIARPISAIQALLGVILIGMFSGLAVVRFSRVGARLEFSDRIVLGEHVGQPALMFRVTNLRLNRLHELNASLYYMWVIEGEDGGFQRRWIELPLLPDTIPMLQFTWMVVAPVSGDSPLQGKSAREIRQMNGLFVAILRGYDDTLAHVIHSHRVWTSDAVVAGTFANVLRAGPDGRPQPVSIDMLNEIRESE